MKKVLKIVGVIVLFIGLAFAFSPYYLKRALIYQYVDIDDHDIFETRTIKTGNPLSWKLAKNYNNYTISDSLKKKIEGYKTVAFLVIQNDSIKFEEYWDGYSDSSLSNAFSATKSIVSLLIGCAIDDGKIKSIEQKVIDFFPEFNGEYGKDLCIKDLLTMSSGLNWDESYGSPFSKTTQAYYGNDLRKLIFDLKVTEKPAEKFNYLSGNTQLLGFILQKATEKNLAEYASEKIWKPIGAQHDALWYLDKKDGMEKAYCCFTSNARDFARIGKLLLDSGSCNGNQVISSSYIAKLFQPDTLLLDENNKKVDYYSLHWWIVDYNGMKITYARGILGQYIFVIPEMNAIVVRLGHERDKAYKSHHPLDVYTYLKAASNILKNNK
ncbi:MAG: serine hydrolase [Bacteroidetes bacterium]|nr:serine hydrolase [Bacteroidota bacterium]